MPPCRLTLQPVLLAGGLRVTWIEGLERDPALDQLLLEHVEHRLGPLLAVGADVDGMVPRTRRWMRPRRGKSNRVLDLLGRLVEGVVDFLPVDTADRCRKRDSAGIVAPSPVGHSPTVKRLLRSG